MKFMRRIAHARSVAPGRVVLLAGAVVTATLSGQPGRFDGWQVVAAGIEHGQWSRPNPADGGPWHIQALRVDLTRARLDVVRALDAAIGLEKVSALAARLEVAAAVNGGYFRNTESIVGDSTGTLVIDGELLSEPDRQRSAFGVVPLAGAHQLIFGMVAWTGHVQADATRIALDGINRARGVNEAVLFTPAFHRTTLTSGPGIEVIVRGGRVTDIRTTGSSTIPSDGFVVSLSGQAVRFAASLRVGTTVDVQTQLGPADASPVNPWPRAEDVLAAGPRLVTNGRVDVTTAREQMIPTFATDRHPRTAIGRLADDRALLVIVDGRQPEWSVGATLDELARLLLDFGVVDAINLDGGGSTTMVVRGTITNRPSDESGERPVSDAIVVRPRLRPLH